MEARANKEVTSFHVKTLCLQLNLDKVELLPVGAGLLAGLLKAMKGVSSAIALNLRCTDAGTQLVGAWMSQVE